MSRTYRHSWDRPDCYECKKRKSRLMGPNGTDEIFCSQNCAVNYAIKHFRQTGNYWCGRHEEWYNDKCQQCLQTAEQFRPIPPFIHITMPNLDQREKTPCQNGDHPDTEK